ncbi:hypothetical protein ABIC22_000373 [Paenibacillus sp. PvP094]|uniref:hypothetical protein n=1 Tax=Paenibacillus sp. PvP094 TaxID=3156394 RepID=UPI003391296C
MMKSNRIRMLITFFFGVTFIVSAGAILYVLKKDKNSMDLGLLLTINSFSFLIVGLNLIVLITKRIQGQMKTGE